VLTAAIRSALVALLLAAVLVVLPRAEPAAAASCADPFDADLHAAIARDFPHQRVTAAVHDVRTGCWYHLAPGTVLTTASVIKAQFLAGVLLRAQDQGRGLTAWEQDRIAPMISRSHNPPASDLYVSLGGAPAQERLDDRFGLTATTSTSRWGLTTSTAEDRTRLAVSLLHGGGPLAAPARDEAWRAMTAVHPTQHWGITAGVPAGWTVAVKNGFYPTSGTPQWRIGSTGFVRDDATGAGYAITVMTDQNPDHETGQRLVELVSRQVASALTTGRPGPRPVDRSLCTTVAVGESWSQVAARLGTGDVAGVRSVSGGPDQPLDGMRACRPDLRVVFDADGPTAHYVRAAFQVFLGRTPSDSELEAHTVALDSGAVGRLQHARSLATSREWVGRSIDALYRSALGRPAEEAGVHHWRDQVAAGLRITDLGALLHGSDERYAAVGSTDSAFVDGLYRDLLHRSPDERGVAHWLGALRSGTDRVTVAAAFYESIESRRDRVAASYGAVLRRPPDTGGLAHWAGELRRVDDVALAAHLAASDEFFGAAQRWLPAQRG
jgi:beta-lactamase class A